MSENHTVPVPSTALTVSDLSFSWPDGTPVFTGLSFSVDRRTHSLVGSNGAGKTTLLRLIAGDLRPATGSVTTVGDVEFVAQNPQADPTRTVADVLAITPIFAALSRVEAGSVDPADFEVIGDDWDIEERARAMLAESGLPHEDLQRTVNSLSGGEATLLTICGALLRRPSVLLLDEPTNNLDSRSRASLFRMIDQFSGVLLVVTHDLELLERVEATLELHNGSTPNTKLPWPRSATPGLIWPSRNGRRRRPTSNSPGVSAPPERRSGRSGYPRSLWACGRTRPRSPPGSSRAGTATT